MEVTPLALTSTSVADQFPVGRQLHQVQACVCSSHKTCHIALSGRSYNQILHHSQSSSSQSAHPHSSSSQSAHPHSQLLLTVSSFSQSAHPYNKVILTVSSASHLIHPHSQYHSQSSFSRVQAHEFDLCVQSLVPAMLTALLL